jgi:hypothetical protein
VQIENAANRIDAFSLFLRFPSPHFAASASLRRALRQAWTLSGNARRLGSKFEEQKGGNSKISPLRDGSIVARSLRGDDCGGGAARSGGGAAGAHGHSSSGAVGHEDRAEHRVGDRKRAEEERYLELGRKNE